MLGRRLVEAQPQEAPQGQRIRGPKTFEILLVVDPKTFGFRRNEDNSLKCAPSIRCSPTSIS